MKSDKEHLLSVSRAAMRLLKAHGTSGRADDPADVPPDAGMEDEKDVRTAAEPVGASPH